ncbi:MAG TPA: hypothetical protein VG820_04600, partial [Fimbriimonadaceae bacterium]|nr:hypothetical protein [Fimbriimonadaceae bacterium]
LFFRLERGSDGKRTTAYFKLDLATGKTLPEPKPKGQPGYRPVQEISAKLESGQLVENGTETKVKNAWLEGSADRTRALIGMDCSDVSLAPTLNAVAYVSNGVAMVRPILQVPKRAFLTAQRNALKAMAMSNAKQVGLATIMYSGDYDDMLPVHGSDFSDILGPYAKNSSIFDGFTYTYSGKSFSDMKDPSKTELGYTAGPGGRAVIFGDGHVEWVPDK